MTWRLVGCVALFDPPPLNRQKRWTAPGRCTAADSTRMTVIVVRKLRQ